MKRVYLFFAVLCVISLSLTACGNNAEGPAVSDYEKQRAETLAKRQRMNAISPAASASSSDDELEEGSMVGSTRGFFYDPVGKRDPFRSFIQENRSLDDGIESPLEGFDLGQLEVAGVVWRGERRRALILDPSGQAYVVSEGDPIGKNSGRILAINDSSMLVKEKYVDFHGEQTEKEIEMRIRQSQGG